MILWNICIVLVMRINHMRGVSYLYTPLHNFDVHIPA